ncbi:MAG: hypothetical protein ACHQ0J_05190 [Candidatus Dormibacterales bacterium]
MKTCYLCGTKFDSEVQLADHHREMHTRLELVSDSDGGESQQDSGQKTTPKSQK